MDTGIVEVVGIAVAALVLIITLGSLVAAGLPLLTAIVGVGAGLGGLAIVSGFVDLNANSLILALMLGDRGRHRLRAVHRLPLPA